MKAGELICYAQTHGIQLWADGEALRCRGDRTAINALLPALRERKPEILQLLSVKVSAANDVAECIHERAAVLKFDHGLSQPAAEHEVISRIVVRFKLTDFYGDPPQQGGGSLLGEVGDTADDLINSLLHRYGDRLLWLKATTEN